jgi:hypothetical protein
MTKRKTALARYIEYLEGIKERDKIPEYAITTGKNYLNTEKQDLIDFGDKLYFIGLRKEDIKVEQVFNQTFENER